MKTSEDLRQQLHSINKKSYPAYKGLKGMYGFGDYILSIDHVQGDPFASPSHISVRISHQSSLHLPGKGFRQERLDLSKPLWSGSPVQNRL